MGIVPERLLLDISTKFKLFKPPKDSGIGPCNLLYLKERSCRLCRPLIVTGIIPDRAFSDKSISITTLRFPISGRREPFREFDDKLKRKISFRFHRVEGIMEVKALEPKERSLREARLPKHAGSLPESLLSPKYKLANLYKWQRSSGMDPSSLLF